MFEIVERVSYDIYKVLDHNDGVIEEASIFDLLMLVDNISNLRKIDDYYVVDFDDTVIKPVYKGIKFRLYPNSSQQEYFSKCFGCCRKVYNEILSRKLSYYESTGGCIDITPAALKEEFTYLSEVDSMALGREYLEVNNAFSNFYSGRAKRPRFHSKHSDRQSYSTNNQKGNIRFDGNYIKLPKIGLVKVKISKKIPSNFKTVIISRTATNKYYVSLRYCDWVHTLPKSGNKTAFDLGTDNLIITSNGAKIKNPKYWDKYQDKLAFYQAELSRKQRGSKSYEKTRLKVARYHEKITNSRNDFLHKLSHRLVNDNQVIVSEDLDIKSMISKLGSHTTHRNIADSSWGKFLTMLTYKSDWCGRTYHKVDRYYPSSQLCSKCGYQNKLVKDISIKTWICPKCNSQHDRDINAATNILRQGLRELGVFNNTGLDTPITSNV